MSFIYDLAKNYAFAAARQAGRNYSNSQNNLYVAPLSQQQSNAYANTADLKPHKEYIIIKLFWASVFSLFFPFIGPLILLYRGYFNYTKNYKLMYRIEKQSVYKKDLRYRDGLRHMGYRDVKVDVKVDIDPAKQSSNRIKAWGYFIISILTLIIDFIVATAN